MSKRMLSLFRNLFRKRAVEQALDDELRSSVEVLTQEKMKDGVSLSVAKREALIELGGVEQVKEEVRAIRAGRLLEDFATDLRFAFRTLAKSPGFAVIAVLTLALGIGANTTIFSAVSAVLLRKPPVKDPDTLCAAASADKAAGNDLVWVSAPDFKSWEEQNGVFEYVAADESGRAFTLTSKDASPQSVEGDRVTPAYFKIIGIAPLLGRTFLPSESQPGNSHVVILSEDLWRERYGSDPKALGEQLNIDGIPCTIVGVMPSVASLPMPFYPPHLWVPLVFSPSDLTPSARGNHYLNMVVARLKHGVTLKKPQADMDSIGKRLAAEYPQTDSHWGVTILTLQEYLIREAQVRPAMMMMMFVVGFVLLIACANVAGLLLERGAVRAHEMAVRVAIGAGRVRLIRQMLTESLLIGATGGAAGLILSIWGIHLLRAGFNFNFYGAQVARGLHLDQRTLLFTLAISLLSAILFGVAPAFRTSKARPVDALGESSRTGSGSFTRSRLRNALVISEIALAVALLAGAGVMLRDLIRGFSMPVGFNPHHLVFANLHLEGRQYKNAEQRMSLFQQVIEKVQNLPGVDSAALDNCIPLGCGYSTSFSIVGQPTLPDSQKPTANYFVVGPVYFRTMQIPFVKGRGFRSTDDLRTPTVAVVNQEFARRYFPKGDAVGKQIEATTLDAKPAQIVGIVGNVSVYVGQMNPKSQIYECDQQFPFTAFSSTEILVRSQLAPSALAPMLRRAVWSIDGDQPVDGMQTMTDLYADNVGGDKLLVTLLGIFAGLALVLASVGIYGVISYSVAQRTREIGIRVALGAQTKDVLGLVLLQGGLITGIGCGIGFLLALPIPWLFAALFSGFTSQEPIVAITVTLVVSIVSLFATYIPARRAMRVDPIVALRYE
jgi:putative ABC transport system permease protein